MSRANDGIRVALAACVLLAVLAAVTPVAAIGASPSAEAVIARYRQRIPELMAEQGVPGIAVALVDGDSVLWSEGFGHTDGDGSAPVTADTIFSVQSMSKLFTATAVMQAVGAGSLDLDEPITTYLPAFTVHSAFEANPERRITLRMLLSHTAGFTHEAPVGNNNALDPGEFDAHVRSISDTWLRFPVGTGYAYSNLGIDLAGYILERVSGKPFAAVMRDSLLGPLGMSESTFDRAEIRATADRAIGHSAPARTVPVDVPMTAAGGLYTSATDLARFLRFQLNGGSIDGLTVLDQSLVEHMRTIPAPDAGAPAGYALGVGRTRWRAGGLADLFSHGGGGFGFLSDLWWVPQLQVGVAVLTNSADHQLQGDLALSILRDLVHEPGSVYGQRLAALPPQADVLEPNGAFQPPLGIVGSIRSLSMAPRGDDAERWAGYTGAFQTPAWDVISPMAPERFVVESGVPYFDANDTGTLVRYRLTEIEAGLFLADNGETLDLRGTVPTWRNLALVRVTGGPAQWQWVLLAVVALAAISWLIAAAWRTLRRIVRHLRPDGASSQTHEQGHRLASAVATLAAVVVLATIACIAAVPGLVDSGFLGWLDMPTAERLALHLPLVEALLAACLVVIGVRAWTRRWWSGATRLELAALTTAVIALTVQLAAWRLIGWGLG